MIIFVLDVVFMAILCGVGMISTILPVFSLSYLWFGWGDGTLVIGDKYGGESLVLGLISDPFGAFALLIVGLLCWSVFWVKFQPRRPQRYTSHCSFLWIVIGGLLALSVLGCFFWDCAMLLHVFS